MQIFCCGNIYAVIIEKAPLATWHVPSNNLRRVTRSPFYAWWDSQAACWHYVKHALFSAGVINSYPKTAYAAEAGDELMRSYGFKRLPIHDPYAAPIGAVLVYGNKARGHVEIRTKDGFVSENRSKNRCFYPLIAVYGKFGS